jgi:hypothetical protein
MKRTRLAAALAIALAVVVSGVVLRARVFAGPEDPQDPAATMALPSPGAVTPLYNGCTTVALTFPDGTSYQTVKETVAPGAEVAALWSYPAGRGGYTGFSTAAPPAVDLSTVGFLDAAWICLAGEPPPAQPPTPPNRFFCTTPGCVTLDGDPAPGSNITATISGNVCGQTTVAEDSTYVVDVVSSGQTAGCGTEGATIDFSTWHSGYFTELELHATSDADGDGVLDTVDNCPYAWNPGQENSDSGRPPSGTGGIDNGTHIPGNDVTIANGDNMGDACDPDLDNDGLPNTQDTNPLGPAMAIQGEPLAPQPVIMGSIALPPPGTTQQLHSECDTIALTFPDGTSTETVLEAAIPAGAAPVMWSFRTDGAAWLGFNAQFPSASDLSTVDFLDVMWMCPAADPAPAQPPTPPNRFFGDVTLDGSPAPEGTNVTATIDGNVCGQTAVQADSKYVLDVVSSGQTAGCGTEGATVDFWVGGLLAGSALWSSGQFTQLDLAAENLCAAYFGAGDGHPNPAGGDVTNDDDNDGDPAPFMGLDGSDDGPSWDTDNDAALDGVECGLAHNPRDRTDRPSTAECGGTGDSDGDGLRDAWETCGWGTSPYLTDTDNDGLGDCKEAADVDGNGLVDFGGDTLYYARAALLPRVSFGRTMDFDINKDGLVDFGADVLGVAKYALGIETCK